MKTIGGQKNDKKENDTLSQEEERRTKTDTRTKYFPLNITLPHSSCYIPIQIKETRNVQYVILLLLLLLYFVYVPDPDSLVIHTAAMHYQTL